MPPAWIPTLWTMRLGAIGTSLLAAALLWFSLSTHRCYFAALEAVFLTINVRLAYVQWFVLIPQWPGRRLKHGFLW